MLFGVSPILGTMTGVLMTLLLITVVVIVTLTLRSEHRIQTSSISLKKPTVIGSSETYDADDRNPDIIPTNKGIYE